MHSTSLRKILIGAAFFVLSTVVAVIGYWLAGWNLLDAIYHFGAAVAKIVENNGLVPGIDQRDTGVGADIACTAGYKNVRQAKGPKREKPEYTARASIRAMIGLLARRYSIR